MVTSAFIDDHDSPWKEALETRFPDFMALPFPDIHPLKRSWQTTPRPVAL
ncbi:hypothetical protein [Billgrantia endophytica]|nr:hypothetical protein [Halomonas endophytica]